MLSCLVREGQNSSTGSYLLRAPFPLLVVTLAAALLALFTSFVAESDLCLPLSENEKKHTCKISAQDLDTTYFFRGILRWKNYLLQAKNLIRPAENFNKKVLLCVYPPPSSDVPSSVLLMLEAGLPVLPGPFCWFAVVAFLAGCSLWWNSFSGTMCTFWLFNRPE